MANKKKKEERVFRIRKWMLILTILFPIAGIGFMAADLHGQRKYKKIMAKNDAELDKIIQKAKEETNNDKDDKEREEES